MRTCYFRWWVLKFGGIRILPSCAFSVKGELSLAQYNYKKGLWAMAACFSLWGFQPLYWHLCQGMETFFMLASRIIWAAAACLALLRIQGKLPQLAAAFRDKKILLREIPATLLLLGDWGVYLWAVTNGRVMECSLGYYIQPLVVFFLGALLFKEKIYWQHFVILAIMAVGIVLSARGFGGVPMVTVSLAGMFAVYAAIKKSMVIDSIVSTTMEIVMMAPLALLFIAFFRMGEDGIGGLTPLRLLLMVGAGLVTCSPMLFYSVGVRNLPLTTAGICQYASPTFSILCSLIMGEVMTREKLVSFLFIWLGVILYTVFTVRQSRRAPAEAH